MRIGEVFSGIDVSARGMKAQRRRMDAIAENIANVDTTRTEKGGPYRRKIVQIREGAQQTFGRILAWSGMALDATDERHFQTGGAGFSDAVRLPGAVESALTEDQNAFKIVHEPSHPDADANGDVLMPNVNVVTEMVDMISASRSYEANVTAINAAKAIAKDSLEI
jgi:flagellar basal-body rod protein FlgC